MNTQKIETLFADGCFPLTRHIRYISGKTIYGESFMGDRLLSSYWTDTGQAFHELYLTPERLRRQSGDFPLDAFELTVNGKKLDRFEFVCSGEKTVTPETDPTGLRSSGRIWYVRLRSEGIEVEVNTRLDGSPYIVRWLDITNKTGAPAGINSVYPLAGRVWAFTAEEQAETIGEEAETPFSVAYNHLTEWCHEGDFYFDPLTGKEFRFDGGKTGISGYSRPAFWLRNRYSGKTLVCEFAYSHNWEFRIRTSSLNNIEQAGFAIGIPETAGEYCRVLDPGELISTPLVHAGYFSGDDDSIVQAAHEYVRHTVMPKAPDDREVEIERGCFIDREDDGICDDIKRDIDMAAAVGAELYLLDAGWFGERPNHWAENCGDWHEGPWMSCPVRSLSDHAHSKGMRFGLWMCIDGAGMNSKLRREHPDWLMSRDGRYGHPFETCLDFSLPHVADWIENTIERVFNENNIDMFRLDGAPAVKAGGNHERSGLKENNLWRYCDNFYAIFDRLRKKYPKVVFQDCSGGGGRLDYGILRRFHNSEISDTYRTPTIVKIYSGLSMAIPPERMLCTLGTDIWNLDTEPDIDFHIRRALVGRPIFRTPAPLQGELNESLLSGIKEKLGLYKKTLRPVIKDCNMYIHTPFQPLLKAADFAVFEYAAKSGKTSFAVFFRLNMDKNGDYFFKPRSLEVGSRYNVYFDNSGKSIEVSGFDLVTRGFNVRFHSSELIIFEALG